MVVPAYAIGAAMVVLFAGLFVTCQQAGVKEEARTRHSARLAGDYTPPAADGQPGPRAVTVGFYVDRIPALAFADAAWTVDFYVWFKWKGDGLDPGAHYQVVDGELNANEVVKRVDDGADHYELRRATATITKVFDISRFPNDDHVLTIAIEDGEKDTSELAYVADTEGSSVSSRIKVTGYAPGKGTILVKDHAYKTTRGDPTLEGKPKAIHSQAVFAVPLHRPDWGLFLKLFLTLYVAVGVSMLVFFIKPTDVDARFGLSVGALFAVMANAYVIQGAVPSASGLSMADLVTGMATLTLLLTLGQSTIALTMCHRGYEDLADKFDRLTMIALTVAFAVVNVTIPMAAMG